MAIADIAALELAEKERQAAQALAAMTAATPTQEERQSQPPAEPTPDAIRQSQQTPTPPVAPQPEEPQPSPGLTQPYVPAETRLAKALADLQETSKRPYPTKAHADREKIALREEASIAANELASIGRAQKDAHISTAEMLENFLDTNLRGGNASNPLGEPAPAALAARVEAAEAEITRYQQAAERGGQFGGARETANAVAALEARQEGANAMRRMSGEATEMLQRAEAIYQDKIIEHNGDKTVAAREVIAMLTDAKDNAPNGTALFLAEDFSQIQDRATLIKAGNYHESPQIAKSPEQEALEKEKLALTKENQREAYLEKQTNDTIAMQVEVMVLKAERQALTEGKTPEEASAIGKNVNEHADRLLKASNDLAQANDGTVDGKTPLEIMQEAAKLPPEALQERAQALVDQQTNAKTQQMAQIIELRGQLQMEERPAQDASISQLQTEVSELTAKKDTAESYKNALLAEKMTLEGRPLNLEERTELLAQAADHIAKQSAAQLRSDTVNRQQSAAALAELRTEIANNVAADPNFADQDATARTQEVQTRLEKKYAELQQGENPPSAPQLALAAAEVRSQTQRLTAETQELATSALAALDGKGNKDGTLDRAELKLDALDHDKNGTVSKEEIAQWEQSHGAGYNNLAAALGIKENSQLADIAKNLQSFASQHGMQIQLASADNTRVPTGRGGAPTERTAEL